MILWPFILTSVNSTCPLVTSRNPKHIWFLSQDHSNCTEQTAILHWTGKGLSAYSKIKFMMCKEIAKDAFHTPQLPHFSQSYPKYLSWILHCYLLAPTHMSSRGVWKIGIISLISSSRLLQNRTSLKLYIRQLKLPCPLGFCAKSFPLAAKSGNIKWEHPLVSSCRQAYRLVVYLWRSCLGQIAVNTKS